MRGWRRSGGAFIHTTVVRATFELLPGTAVLAEDQEDPNVEDDHWNDDPSRSVVAPSDLVPWKEGADVVLVTLGSVAGIVRETVDRLRARGVAAGMLKLRFMRPFPEREIVQALSTARSVGVLEKDVSFGHQGAVFSEVSSALAGSAARPALLNFVAGLGGRDISRNDVEQMFVELQDSTVGTTGERVRFTGIEETSNG